MTVEKAAIVADVCGALASDDLTGAAVILNSGYRFEPVSRVASGVTRRPRGTALSSAPRPGHVRIVS